MRLEEREEVVAGEEGGAGVLERGRGRRARATVEERELPEEVARSHDRDERLLAELAREGDLHSAVEHDVQMSARIVLPEEGLPAFEEPRAHALRKLEELRLGELREERVAP